MAILAIRTVPDPVLHQISAPIEVFDAALKRLTDDMLATMYDAKGRGFAAPQVGVLSRVFVMDATWKTGAPAPMACVNPRVAEASETTAILAEGCLSIPDKLVEVSRPDCVRLRWQDLTGSPQEAAFDGFAAACVQHEIDHLNGVLITDGPS